MKTTKDEIFQIILGTMLGDGGFEFPSSTSGQLYPKMRVTHCLEKETNQTILLKDLISEHYKTGIFSKDKNKNTIRFGVSSTETEITSALLELTRYDDRKRKIPVSNITPLVLLFWYLDDGSLSVGKQKRKNSYTIFRRLKITGKSYKEEDILECIDFINKSYNLNFRPDRENGRVIGMIISNNKKEKPVTSKKQFVNVNKKPSKPSRYGKLFAEEEK